MPVSLLPNGRQTFTDHNGVPLVGGSVAIYQPGTLTYVETFQDSAGTISNTNPITLDALGSASIWVFGTVRQILSDQLGNTIWDQVTAAPPANSGSLEAANNLSDVGNVAQAQTNLGLKSAAQADTGSSGHTVPFLDAANTFSEPQTFADGASITPSSAPAANAVGYLGTPQEPVNGNYTLSIADAGTQRFVTANCAVTIPLNSTGNPFQNGMIFDLAVDQTFVATITAAGGVTLRNPNGNVTGTRTVTGPGTITIQQVKTNEFWVRGGANIS